MRINFFLILLTTLCLSGCSDKKSDGEPQVPSCSNNDGQTVIDSTAGNSIFHDSGPWGARPENSYVFDDTTDTAYIVGDIQEPTMCNNNLCDYITSLYACNQNTGVKGAYQATSGLSGHNIIFFANFSDLEDYRDVTQNLCTSN
ncbi:MAG TPA: hypothetical protein PKC21_04725 [Oligoflexia bacterium]|nr:hypothetical protein [Oligoflexia bacterium]HMR24641.1 hypothetical protein [Oligoflexia bacterium]